MTTIIPAENSYVALLSFAEGFRTTTPPDLKSCLQCLLAASNLQLDVRSLLKTHLQIVKLILNHTDNIHTAQSYCEKAVSSFLIYKNNAQYYITSFPITSYLLIPIYIILSIYSIFELHHLYSKSISGSSLKTYQHLMN